jgi:hypothetical protein
MGRALAALLAALLDGDPVAWTATGIFLATVCLFGLFWLKTVRDLRREDESRKKRWGGSKKKN